MVTHLAPGEYNVRGQAPGFKSKTVLQVRVFADQGARVDLQFEIGVPTESVTVSAEDLPLLKNHGSPDRPEGHGRARRYPIPDPVS